MRKNYVIPRTTRLKARIKTNVLQASQWPGGPAMPDEPFMPDDSKKAYTDFE